MHDLRGVILLLLLVLVALGVFTSTLVPFEAQQCARRWGGTSSCVHARGWRLSLRLRSAVEGRGVCRCSWRQLLLLLLHARCSTATENRSAAGGRTSCGARRARRRPAERGLLRWGWLL